MIIFWLGNKRNWFLKGIFAYILDIDLIFFIYVYIDVGILDKEYRLMLSERYIVVGLNGKGVGGEGCKVLRVWLIWGYLFFIVWVLR